jgi:hypothetical protein
MHCAYSRPIRLRYGVNDDNAGTTTITSNRARSCLKNAACDRCHCARDHVHSHARTENRLGRRPRRRMAFQAARGIDVR